MPPANAEVCAICGLYPFMILASCNESQLSVVFVLLRQVLSCQVPSLISCD